MDSMRYEEPVPLNEGEIISALSLCIRGGGGEVFLGARGGQVNQLTARREGGHHTSRIGRGVGRREREDPGCQEPSGTKTKQPWQSQCSLEQRGFLQIRNATMTNKRAEDLARRRRALRLSLFPSPSCNLSKLSKQLPQLEAVSPIHLILPNSMATAAAKAAAVASGSNTWVKRG